VQEMISDSGGCGGRVPPGRAAVAGIVRARWASDLTCD
jgi:hypothetical protein